MAWSRTLSLRLLGYRSRRMVADAIARRHKLSTQKFAERYRFVPIPWVQGTPPRVLLPFHDDSTLFFAKEMERALIEAGAEPVSGWFYNTANAGTISRRQIFATFPNGPDISFTCADLQRKNFLRSFSSVITARPYGEFDKILKMDTFRKDPQRPIFLAFLGGLDFTPELGIENRLLYDTVYLTPRNLIPVAENIARKSNIRWRCNDFSFGHPYFVRQVISSRKSRRGNIYFFPQAISPRTLRGRMDMARLLVEMARTYPDQKIVCKLRHLREENATHLHREKYDYQTLLENIGNLPPNIEFSDAPMHDIIDDISMAITATSTAAVNTIASGIPTYIYLSFEEREMDPLVSRMEEIFRGSGVIASREDILTQRKLDVSEGWAENILCEEDFAQRIVRRITEFRSARGPVP